MAKGFAEALIAEIRRHGVGEYRIEHGGKHPHLVFLFGGHELKFPFQSTPSDHRALLNKSWRTCAIEWVCSASSKGVRSGTAPATERDDETRAALPASFTLTHRADPFACLAAHPLANAQIDETVDHSAQPSTETSNDARHTHHKRTIALRTPWLGEHQRWQQA